MTLERTGADLLHITEVTREEVLKVFNTNSCIASTRAVIEVLRYFGHPSKPLPVTVMAFNAAGWQWAHKEVPVADWPPEAWSVGIAGTGTVNNALKRWDGHLVAMTDDEKFLIDASLDQVSRPDRNIDLHPSIFGFTDPWPEEAIIRFERPDGVVLLYHRLHPPGQWWASPDWKGRQAEIKHVVGRAIRRLRNEHASV